MVRSSNPKPLTSNLKTSLSGSPVCSNSEARFFFCLIIRFVGSLKFEPSTVRWRPYRNEYTGSLQNSEVNRCRARIVLRWGTAREVLRVLPALFFETLRCVLTSSKSDQKSYHRLNKTSYPYGNFSDRFLRRT